MMKFNNNFCSKVKCQYCNCDVNIYEWKCNSCNNAFLYNEIPSFYFDEDDYKNKIMDIYDKLNELKGKSPLSKYSYQFSLCKRHHYLYRNNPCLLSYISLYDHL